MLNTEDEPGKRDTEGTDEGRREVNEAGGEEVEDEEKPYGGKGGGLQVGTFAPWKVSPKSDLLGENGEPVAYTRVEVQCIVQPIVLR